MGCSPQLAMGPPAGGPSGSKCPCSGALRGAELGGVPADVQRERRMRGAGGILRTTQRKIQYSNELRCVNRLYVHAWQRLTVLGFGFPSGVGKVEGRRVSLPAFSLRSG